MENGLSPGDTGASVNRPGRADRVLFPHQHIVLNPAFTGGTNTLFGNPSHPGDIAQYASPEYLPPRPLEAWLKYYKFLHWGRF